MGAALDYREPDIVSILVLSSFLLLLNISNHVLNSYLSCGLVAQILVGIAWGTPGAKLLNDSAEDSITWIGYLGLILLVFEGGLSTNIRALRSNFILSLGVAITGITIPVALSFILIQLADATPLQSFASGAALCSTSLGTAFTILKASNFAQTRLGSVLTSAAMLDDIAGLVLIQVISNLNGALKPASIVRPVGVSIAFTLFAMLFCFSMKYCDKVLASIPAVSRIFRYQHSRFVAQTLFLIGMVTGASYAGTSSLFASYLAGVCCNWYYEHNAMRASKRPVKGDATASSLASKTNAQSAQESSIPYSEEFSEAILMYNRYYLPIVDGILKPFFFASIGFAIPVTRMFEGMVVWRGLVYALLMVIAKMLTGLWLILFDLDLLSRLKQVMPYIHKQTQRLINKSERKVQPSIELSCRVTRSACDINESTDQVSPENATTSKQTQAKTKKPNDRKPERATSLYPAAILGMAMVARGEIGFLIAATAQSTGVLSQGSSQTLYLTVIWAIVLCTIIGPVMTGLLVKRVKRLQQLERSAAANERKDPMGLWGLL